MKIISAVIVLLLLASSSALTFLDESDYDLGSELELEEDLAVDESLHPDGVTGCSVAECIQACRAANSPTPVACNTLPGRPLLNAAGRCPTLCRRPLPQRFVGLDKCVSLCKPAPQDKCSTTHANGIHAGVPDNKNAIQVIRGFFGKTTPGKSILKVYGSFGSVSVALWREDKPVGTLASMNQYASCRVSIRAMVAALFKTDVTKVTKKLAGRVRASIIAPTYKAGTNAARTLNQIQAALQRVGVSRIRVKRSLCGTNTIFDAQSGVHAPLRSTKFVQAQFSNNGRFIAPTTFTRWNLLGTSLNSLTPLYYVPGSPELRVVANSYCSCVNYLNSRDVVVYNANVYCTDSGSPIFPAFQVYYTPTYSWVPVQTPAPTNPPVPPQVVATAPQTHQAAPAPTNTYVPPPHAHAHAQTSTHHNTTNTTSTHSHSHPHTHTQSPPPHAKLQNILSGLEHKAVHGVVSTPKAVPSKMKFSVGLHNTPRRH